MEERISKRHRALKLRLLDDEALSKLIFDLEFFERFVAAGFPSPADDYLPQELDLNSHLIRNPESTYFLRVYGDSMEGAGIRSGDILIADRAIEPSDNKVIVACINGELIVKRIRMLNGNVFLMSENERYKPIKVTAEMDFEVWGVVIHVIHSL